MLSFIFVFKRYIISVALGFLNKGIIYMIDVREERQLFILRRAFWFGRVKRSEVMDVFKISDNQASLDLKRAVFERWKPYIRRDGLTGHSGVVPIYGVQAPAEASASKMLSLFERHAEYNETGLSQSEFNLLVCKAPVYRANDSLLEVVMQACIHSLPIEILYVGLRKDEEARWRQVLPNGMEFTGRQWRLIAQDISDEKQKTYVLPRILSARTISITSKIKKINRIGIGEAEELYTVTLNSEMTKDQVSAISNELGVDGSYLKINSRNVYEFRKLYCDDRSGLEHIVWPVVKDIKKVD